MELKQLLLAGLIPAALLAIHSRSNKEPSTDPKAFTLRAIQDTTKKDTLKYTAF